MRKIMLAIFLGLLLFMSTVYCQEITEKERKIYNEYSEKFTLLMDEGFQKTLNIQKEVEKKYGISENEYSDILMKHETFQEVRPAEVTAKERQILDYYDKRVKEIDAGKERKYNELIEQIADKAGITVDETINIILKCSAQDPAYSLEE